MPLAPTRILSLILFLLIIISSSSAKVVKEEFSEELLLKPLPDRKVLAHFHFQTKAPIHEHSFARYHHLFPKSIAQLVCLHFSLL
jgi:GPI-anchor transamidase subunit T